MTSQNTNQKLPAYHGRYLHVDVTTARGEFVPLAEDTLRRTLGGVGLGTHLLMQHGAATIEPLAPEAALAFVFSPLVGSPLTTSAKFAVVSKSPLTKRLNDSLASSHFAMAGKKTGADAIVITGASSELSVLVIDDGDARLETAKDLAGLSISTTEAALRDRFGRDYHFAVIGPAGENQVHFATISHDGRHAGRGGSGAVLGAKNIKAIAVRGTHRCAWADSKRLTEYAKDLSRKSFGPATAKYRELGTAANLLTFNRLAALPTRNFQRGSFESATALAPETLTSAREKTRASCAACTIGCEHIYGLASDDPKGESKGVRLEYESLFALGPLCEIRDPDTLLTAAKRCDEYGLDTISTGGTIAFAMECVERGLLDEPWLRFGDGAALLKAIDLIASRQGSGERLALGSRRLALELGGEAIDFAPQVKGLEIPGYEPRALQTMALGFAVGSRGADHNRSGAYEVDFSDDADRRNVTTTQVLAAIETEDRAAIMDSLILCKFLRGVFTDFFAETAEMLRLTTGWNITSDELKEAAQRIVADKKRFNIAAGWTPAEDTLPARFLKSALPEDPRASLSRDELTSLIREYHRQRGWTMDGYLPRSSEHAGR